MKYREMTIETTEAGIEAVTACLMTAGIDNIEVADPADIIEIMAQKNSYTWDYIEEAAAEARKDVPRIRLDFTREDGAAAARVIRDYERILASGKASAPVPRNIYDKSVL